MNNTELIALVDSLMKPGDHLAPIDVYNVALNHDGDIEWDRVKIAYDLVRDQRRKLGIKNYISKK